MLCSKIVMRNLKQTQILKSFLQSLLVLFPRDNDVFILFEKRDILYSTSGSTLFMVLTREGAVDGWRTLCGKTDPAEAKAKDPNWYL